MSWQVVECAQKLYIFVKKQSLQCFVTVTLRITSVCFKNTDSVVQDNFHVSVFHVPYVLFIYIFSTNVFGPNNVAKIEQNLMVASS